MKKVILCEGKYDGIFISHILKKAKYSNEEYKLFDAQTIDKGKKNEETRVIRNFINGKDPYAPKILVKAECGKQFALKVLCREFATFINGVKDIVLLLDTDSKNFPQTIKWIESFFIKKFSSIDFSISTESIEEEGDFNYSKMTFSVSGDPKGFMHLVLINKSLEEVCKITSLSKKHEKLDKIKKLSEEKDLNKFFPCLDN